MTNILFLHGWQSVPGGVKPTHLAQHGHEVINPKLPDEDFTEAVKIAQEEFDKHQPQVVVGSSRGGAVAMNINSGSGVILPRRQKGIAFVNLLRVNLHVLFQHSGALDEM